MIIESSVFCVNDIPPPAMNCRVSVVESGLYVRSEAPALLNLNVLNVFGISKFIVSVPLFPVIANVELVRC